jgi:type IV pilus biogenesis protein CpaD/CtpE
MLLLKSLHKAVLLMGLLGLLSACTPTVQVALPNEPININLNVKIQHEILIKVDKQLDAMFSESSGLF